MKKMFLMLLLPSLSLFSQDVDIPSLLQGEYHPPAREMPLEDSVNSLTHGNSTFAYNLYGQLKGQKGNLFFSPYSISSAMVIPYIGSRGGTQNQIQSTMHYIPREENLDRAFAELNRRFTKSWMQGPNEVRLFMGNGMWVQRNMKLEENFLKRITQYFGAVVKSTDFMRNPDSARLNINDWVREATQGRIPMIIDRGDVSSDTRLVVVSSIFLKAVWENPFNPSTTTSEPFFIDPTSTISVPMMHLTKNLRVLQHPQFTLLELPYSKSPVSPAQFQMLLLLPTSIEGIAKLEDLLVVGDLEEWIHNMQTEQVIVSLPRFKFSTSLDLVDPLKKMGMPAAFTDLADFTGIFGGGGLFLNRVLHKAFISVDEKGTEAVAATAVSINVTSMLQEKPPVVFKADHPFVFVIFEKSTESILFMGRFSVPPTH